MSQSREVIRSAAPPQANIQDAFLNQARRDRAIVTFHLMDGSSFSGRIKNFDRFAMVVDQDGTDRMLFKHAIASITASRSTPSAYPARQTSADVS